MLRAFVAVDLEPAIEVDQFDGRQAVLETFFDRKAPNARLRFVREIKQVRQAINKTLVAPFWDDLR